MGGLRVLDEQRLKLLLQIEWVDLRHFLRFLFVELRCSLTRGGCDQRMVKLPGLQQRRLFRPCAGSKDSAEQGQPAQQQSADRE